MSALLPLVLPLLAGVTPDTVFVSEVVYNPSGTEPDTEWIELVNVADVAVSLDELRIGDSESEPDNEGILQFPAGATIPALGHIVIANKSTAYQATSGHKADYELKASDASVAKLTADTALGGTLQLSLANSTDEVLLMDVDGFIVDGVSWGRADLIDGVVDIECAEGESVQRDFDADGPTAWRAGTPTPGVVVIDVAPAEEPPPDEAPVDQEPVDEPPVDEEPVDEEPVDEEPVVGGEGEDEEPVVEEPGEEEEDLDPALPVTDRGDDVVLAPVPQTQDGGPVVAAGACAASPSSSSSSSTLPSLSLALLLLLSARWRRGAAPSP